MKPIYNACTGKWRVKGIGLFDTPAEAREAIVNKTKNVTVSIRISKETESQLSELATKRNTTVSDIVRGLIEKEVRENG